MKSNKQRRAELRELRAEREAKRQAKAIALKALQDREKIPGDVVLCNLNLLAPSGSYSVPPFVTRGYYVDIPFQCIDCQKQEVWLATQQQWWYEVAKGDVASLANRCRPCRKIERDRKTEARRIPLEGLDQKTQPDLLQRLPRGLG
jgi:hypothetical protein